MRMNTAEAAYRQSLSEQGLEAGEIEEKARAWSAGPHETNLEATLQSADRENGTSESVAAQSGELEPQEPKKAKSRGKKVDEVDGDPKDGSMTTDDLK